MQRRLIKAQNDVLATVGVCRRDTKQNQVLSEAIVQENEVGLLVGAVDLTITYLTTWPLIGIRNRLQVCGFSGVSVESREGMKAELKRRIGHMRA